VGEGVSAARFRLADASAVRAWLGKIAGEQRFPEGASP